MDGIPAGDGPKGKKLKASAFAPEPAVTSYPPVVPTMVGGMYPPLPHAGMPPPYPHPSQFYPPPQLAASASHLNSMAMPRGMPLPPFLNAPLPMHTPPAVSVSPQGVEMGIEQPMPGARMLPPAALPTAAPLAAEPVSAVVPATVAVADNERLIWTNGEEQMEEVRSQRWKNRQTDSV
jgi:hypothetical protein